MSKPKLLITGINGLIGKVIRDPLTRSYDVYGLDVTPPYSEKIFRTCTETIFRTCTRKHYLGSSHSLCSGLLAWSTFFHSRWCHFFEDFLKIYDHNYPISVEKTRIVPN